MTAFICARDGYDAHVPAPERGIDLAELGIQKRALAPVDLVQERRHLRVRCDGGEVPGGEQLFLGVHALLREGEGEFADVAPVAARLHDERAVDGIVFHRMAVRVDDDVDRARIFARHRLGELFAVQDAQPLKIDRRPQSLSGFGGARVGAAARSRAALYFVREYFYKRACHGDVGSAARRKSVLIFRPIM